MPTVETLIVFDFDGVICNSFYDSLYTAIHAYFTLKPENELPLKRPLTPKTVRQFEGNYPDFCRSFYELMPLGNFAADYYVTLEILTAGRPALIQNQDDFNHFKNSLASTVLDDYSRAFYEFRRSMQNHRPGEWAALLPPFPGIPETIHALAGRHQLAIATSKDIASVTILLNEYGLTGCFPTGNILDKDYAESKRAHLETFHRQHGIPYMHMHFIDDKVLHLVSVTDLGVVCYLASWGFNTAREERIARYRGCRVLALDELAAVGS